MYSSRRLLHRPTSAWCQQSAYPDQHACNQNCLPVIVPVIDQPSRLLGQYFLIRVRVAM